MQDNMVLTRRHGRVAVIELNRPAQLNALNDALMDALGTALLEMDSDPGVGCIVLTGWKSASRNSGTRRPSSAPCG